MGVFLFCYTYKDESDYYYYKLFCSFWAAFKLIIFAPFFPALFIKGYVSQKSAGQSYLAGGG